MFKFPAMNRTNVPPWVKKYGMVGLLVFVVLAIIRLAIEAIFQQEISSLWSNHIRPYLTSNAKIQIDYEVPRLLLLVLVILLLALGYIAFRLITRPKRVINGRLNPKAFHSPTKQPESYTIIEVIKAKSRLSKGLLSSEDFAKIVEQTVNLNKLRPEVGTEFLEECGYILVMRSDKSYSAQKKQGA